jgi:hypothetical protein
VKRTILGFDSEPNLANVDLSANDLSAITTIAGSVLHLAAKTLNSLDMTVRTSYGIINPVRATARYAKAVAYFILRIIQTTKQMQNLDRNVACLAPYLSERPVGCRLHLAVLAPPSSSPCKRRG